MNTWYKSAGVFLKVVVIEHEVEALAVLCSEQDATIQI